MNLITVGASTASDTVSTFSAYGAGSVDLFAPGTKVLVPTNTGGYGFAAEYDVERKFRETRLYQVAPISTNLILSYVAEHILGLPRSF